MPNKNLFIIDVPTWWNLTFDMIIAAWEKRKVLNAMATNFQKDGREIILLHLKSGSFLRYLQMNF